MKTHSTYDLLTAEPPCIRKPIN